MAFAEIIAIANLPSRARDLKSTTSLNWYWLATTMFFLYNESLIYYFKHIVLLDKALRPLATHSRFLSFVLYMFGTCAMPHSERQWPGHFSVLTLGRIHVVRLEFEGIDSSLSSRTWRSSSTGAIIAQHAAFDDRGLTSAGRPGISGFSFRNLAGRTWP
jgi:hypothetical protein